MKVFFLYLQLAVTTLFMGEIFGQMHRQMHRPRRSLATAESKKMFKKKGFSSKSSKKKKSSKKSPNSAKHHKPRTIKHLPTREMTGLDPEFVQLLSTINENLYADPLSLESFELSGYTKAEAKVIRLETNGIFEVANSPFAVVVVDQTMILAWRGSQTLADWIRDFSFAPSSSSRWSNVAKVVKVSSGDLSLVETCLGENEEYLIEQIEARNITQIVTTGHSLGGMIAFAANMWLVGSWTPGLNGGITNPKWAPLQAAQGLSVRTMTFEAGMNAMFYKSPKEDDVSVNELGMEFLRTVGSTTVNTVFDDDVVPRAPGNLLFVEDAINNLIYELPDEPFPGFDLMIYLFVKYWEEEYGFRSQILMSYEPILKRFQHMGTLIHYNDADAEPKIYIDPREDGLDCYDTDEDICPPHFSNIKYKFHDDTNVAEFLVNQHNFIVDGPGMSFS